MKINMGSNDVHKEGFLNLDIRKIEGVDIVDDFTKLDSLEDESVDEIIAHNVLEHNPTDEVFDILSLWVRKMKKGATISIGVPDGELIFSRYIMDHDWSKVTHNIFGNLNLLREWFGDQVRCYIHHTLFCKASLIDLMQKCGLGDIVETTPNHPYNVTLIATKL